MKSDRPDGETSPHRSASSQGMSLWHVHIMDRVSRSFHRPLPRDCTICATSRKDAGGRLRFLTARGLGWAVQERDRVYTPSPTSHSSRPRSALSNGSW